MHFERNSDVYDRARPPYPPALWRCLRELNLLRTGGRALDLGAGTGQATGPLVEAGLRVTAIEPGPRLANLLRAQFPTVDVLVQTAEEAELPRATFDVAVAATSVHWMDLDAMLPKLHGALRPEGHFLVWWTMFGDPSEVTPFRERVQGIVAARGPQPSRGTEALSTDQWAHVLTAGGYFAIAHIEHFRWAIDRTERQIHDLFTTFSNWTVPEVDEAADAVRDLGGTVTEHYVTPLIVLRRKANTSETSVR